LILVAGLHANDPGMLAALLAAATLATVLADIAWYAAGSRYGVAVLLLMCKVSLSPDSCVLRTRGTYARWGPWTLVAGKFVPGLAAVATVLAGSTHLPRRTFVAFDAAGALLWASVPIVLGALFHTAVRAILDALDVVGGAAIGCLAMIAFAYVGTKWWQRRRYLNQLRMDRITAQELADAMAGADPPRLLDVRSPDERNSSGWIPGSEQVGSLAAIDGPKSRELVLCCDCPNEASAAVFALELKRLGFQRVLPLLGGVAHWRATGLPIEREQISAREYNARTEARI
jgi:membrane protein DedA with SNARE-associated domain/rhodanese-related sulfurtransferase